MDRDTMLDRLATKDLWDIIVIGGGATGLGVAVDAASRGYTTVLLEQHDFGKGTSSRSTKLAHGGVRYLQQGRIRLVKEALRERAIMRHNAPHLVHDLGFVVPTYGLREWITYGFGLTVYDLLAGRSGFGRSNWLSPAQTQARLPTLAMSGIRGGILYHDGQFDDARLVINLAQTAVAHGAVLANYMPVVDMRRAHGSLYGVVACDSETDHEYPLRARVIINATGVFADTIRQMDTPNATPLVRPSQGVHLVLDAACLPGGHALMVPRTDDGRVLFAIPWHNVVIVGTTDTPREDTPVEPQPLPEEIAFLVEHIGRYLTKPVKTSDIRSIFAGLRPLVAGEGHTAGLSREHTIEVSDSGLLSIVGGKWTTYRRMAETAVDRAAALASLPLRPSLTSSLPIHGAGDGSHVTGELAHYGTDATCLEALMQDEPTCQAHLHPAHRYRVGEVVWAVRHEMARTVEDVLARRLRALRCDARSSLEMAPQVAAILATELHRDAVWQQQQVQAFHTLATQALLP